ncbi:MAG: hypothetical protein JWM78_2863 [Verrucomicrobiaceae bacterium]|nr:hypothetical protein [Verrucomicrobiaceae bacterium]
MNDIEKLLAYEAIKQTKARYFRSMDGKDWAGYAAVFTEDVQMRIPGEANYPAVVVDGRADVVAHVRGVVEHIVTVHHGHMPIIELTSDTTADVVWAMEDKLWKPAGSPSQLPFDHLHGYGHYVETYRRVGDKWLINTFELTRLRVDIS